MGGDLFESLREGRVGVQFERTLRVLCFLLHEWCGYGGPRSPTEGEQATGLLRAIYFDKFAMLVSRVWGRLAQVGRPALSRPVEGTAVISGDDSVTFPFPLQEVSGKHGRGLARWDGASQPRYIVEILHKLAEENIAHYFRIDAHKEGPSDYRSEVKPGLPISNDKEFLEGLTSRELELLQELAGALKHLRPGEIRALGTHCDRTKTLEDIDREFRYLEKRLCWDLLLERLSTGKGFSVVAAECLEYVEEALRKAMLNRKAYREGRRILLNECRTETLRSAISECQPEEALIWGSPDMERRAERARRLVACVGYAAALGHFQEHAKERSHRIASRSWELWDKALGELKVCALGQDLPTDPVTAFEGNPGEITPSVRDRLISLFRSLREG